MDRMPEVDPWPQQVFFLSSMLKLVDKKSKNYLQYKTEIRKEKYNPTFLILVHKTFVKYWTWTIRKKLIN